VGFWGFGGSPRPAGAAPPPPPAAAARAAAAAAVAPSSFLRALSLRAAGAVLHELAVQRLPQRRALDGLRVREDQGAAPPSSASLSLKVSTSAAAAAAAATAGGAGGGCAEGDSPCWLRQSGAVWPPRLPARAPPLTTYTFFLSLGPPAAAPPPRPSPSAPPRLLACRRGASGRGSQRGRGAPPRRGPSGRPGARAFHHTRGERRGEALVHPRHTRGALGESPGLALLGSGTLYPRCAGGLRLRRPARGALQRRRRSACRTPRAAPGPCSTQRASRPPPHQSGSVAACRPARCPLLLLLLAAASIAAGGSIILRTGPGAPPRHRRRSCGLPLCHEGEGVVHQPAPPLQALHHGDAPAPGLR